METFTDSQGVEYVDGVNIMNVGQLADGTTVYAVAREYPTAADSKAVWERCERVMLDASIYNTHSEDGARYLVLGIFEGEIDLAGFDWAGGIPVAVTANHVAWMLTRRDFRLAFDAAPTDKGGLGAVSHYDADTGPRIRS